MIGRKEEQRLLRNAVRKEEAQFLVVYGRRRVGKTYLIRETFGNDFTFSYAGIAGVKVGRQLAEFEKALHAYGLEVEKPLENWFDAFDGLRVLLERSEHEKRIVFIDEMPWMDNKRSEFVPALEHFWNGWAAGAKNLTLIVCGSAASWITKKIFRNKGGLYNRMTLQIALKPFTLGECRDFFAATGVQMNLYDMIGCYMILGGIPYYLNMLDGRYGLSKNIDRLCFSESALLRNEYDAIFGSLFTNPEKYTEVVEVISRKKSGLTREEIKTMVGFPDGGNLTRILNELAESGFIRMYKPFGRKKNGALYQLSDPFTAFHLTWMKDRGAGNDDIWSSLTGSGEYNAWSGYAFEQVCLAHIPQIRNALGIAGVRTSAGAWRSSGTSAPRAQIDLVVDRSDNVINLCEMKYANQEFSIDKQYDLALRNKADVFRRETKTRKALHLTMVTTYGVKQNIYSSVFQSEITMEDLFE
jgi:AAA+ ATPase superfamily predicted ATPase